MQIYNDRHALHRIPELGKDLPKTMAYLRAALTGLNCRVFAPMEGSLCAFFDFGKQEAIAFRADADARPLRRRPTRTMHPPTPAGCTPAATTAIWRFCWSWPGG